VCTASIKGVWDDVRLAGLESWEIVLKHLKAILMLVCLKSLLIFLICGEV
jgi:hypothetical protein